MSITFDPDAPEWVRQIANRPEWFDELLIQASELSGAMAERDWPPRGETVVLFDLQIKRLG